MTLPRRRLGLLAGLLFAVAQPARAATPGGALSLAEVLDSVLRRSPETAAAQQRAARAAGALAEQRGRFDLQLAGGLARRRTALTDAPGATLTDSWQVSATRRLPTGLALGPSASLERVDERGVARSSGRFDFTLTQPLLRGRGRAASGADERAARDAEQAARARLAQVRAEQLAAAAGAYWGYRGAHEALRIEQGAVERATLFLEEERRLVDAREHAPADLQPVRANLAEARANVGDARRGLALARQELALLMGVDWATSAALGTPSDAWAEAATLAPLDVEGLIALAWRERPELRAAGLEQSAAETLLRGARRALTARVDLVLAAGFSGAAGGPGGGASLWSFGRLRGGPDWMAGLDFDLSAPRRAARGALAQRQARAAELAVATGDARRRIALEVAAAAALFEAAWHERRDAREARDAFQVALDNERSRLRSALSTTFDVLQVETRLTAAQRAVARAEERLSRALTQLRFATGTLFEAGHDQAPAHAWLTTPPVP